MVVRISREQQEAEELRKLAAKGITEDELEDVVAEYKEESEQQTKPKSFEAIKEQYKREKTQTNFESGVGGFKRSQ